MQPWLALTSLLAALPACSTGAVEGGVDAADVAQVDDVVDDATTNVDAPADDAPSPDGDAGAPDTDVGSEWVLQWSDEFEGDTIDDDRWRFELGNGDGGWGTGQVDYATDRPENARVDDGMLVLTLREESFEGFDYTGARMLSREGWWPRFGRIEVRARVGIETQGLGAAFWMLGSTFEQVGWPACGEIDIFEITGRDPELNIGTAHFEMPWGHHHDQGRVELAEGEAMADAFHVYGIEWDEDALTWTFDGEPYHTLDLTEPIDGRWPFHQPFTIILSVGVGGMYSGPPDDTTELPAEVAIDWLRVYERPEGYEEPRPLYADPDDPRASGQAALPFAVDDVFVAAGYMGDGEVGGVVDEGCGDDIDTTWGRCHRFTWTWEGRGWAGVTWQAPAGNWGDEPGALIEPGATRVRFRAWGEEGGEIVSFFAGSDADGFSVEQSDVTLRDTPREYTMRIRGADYDDVTLGFGWSAGGGAKTFYVDDIRWE